MKINYDIVKTIFGSKVREYRRNKDITQEHLAEISEISTGFLKDIESGRSCISLVTLLHLCNALTITPNDLLQDFITKPLTPDNLKQQIDILPEREKNAIYLLIDHFNEN